MKRPQPPSADARMPVLVAERNRKMASSAHAYVRGSTARFYEWLEGTHRTPLPDGPDVWICGDCHVGNLGPIVSRDGALAIQIRDLDQTVIGNPAHDLIRLGLSLAMAARGSDLPGVVTVRMLECMMEGYEAAFDAGHEGGDDEEADGDGPVAVPKQVKLVLQEAAGRSWKHLADERIEGVEPEIPLGKRFWPLTAQERDAIKALFARDEMHALATSLRSRDSDAEVRFVDAAYWRKGCSSLGRLRVAVLLAIGRGKSARHCLMDVKEAIAAVAPHSADAVMPADHAARVVMGARHLSPYLGKRVVAGAVSGKSVFVRELMPQDLKLEIERLSTQEAMEAAAYLAHVVGRGHVRQMAREVRRDWHGDLQRNRSKSLDAPSWLWRSVVDLVAAHEAAYLEHCRRYALEE